jgi:hypothetical protein
VGSWLPSIACVEPKLAPGRLPSPADPNACIYRDIDRRHQAHACMIEVMIPKNLSWTAGLGRSPAY